MRAKNIIIYSPQRTIGLLVEDMISGCDGGLEIIQVGTIELLLETAKRHSARLIIMLDTTPLINGSDIVARLHKDSNHRIYGQTHRRTAIYVITWGQSEHTVLSLLEAGIDQYLTFPICIARLRHKICEQMADYAFR